MWEPEVGSHFENRDENRVGVREPPNMVLAQAKNADQLFWEEKFHAANGKAQASTQGALFFFP